MANPEGDRSQSQRTSGMGHGDEHGPKATTRPWNVGLDTATEPGAVASFCLTGDQARLWYSAATAQLSLEGTQFFLGSRWEMREVFL
jgi:hypothetical protein